eukprot:6072129-Alexandrium_andersonii.AAC.1
MSASLVGSEMCIRDRPSRLDLDNRHYTQPSGSNALDLKNLAVWWVGEGAVSYTHLTLPTICSV